MPTYEYQCSACDHRFEKFQSMTAKAIEVCPQCGKKKVRRLISAGAGLIFKGSGFYITDYRSDNYKNAAKGDAAPTAAGAGDAKATDAKPADSKSSDPKPASASKPAGNEPAAKPKPESKPATPAKAG